MPKRRGRYPLRAHKDLVLAALVAGATQAEIARKYEVTVQAVSYFVGQHADELVRLTREAQERVRDVAIAEVEERVRRKAALLARMDTVLVERGRVRAGGERGALRRAARERLPRAVGLGGRRPGAEAAAAGDHGARQSQAGDRLIADAGGAGGCR